MVFLSTTLRKYQFMLVSSIKATLLISLYLACCLQEKYKFESYINLCFNNFATSDPDVGIRSLVCITLKKISFCIIGTASHITPTLKLTLYFNCKISKCLTNSIVSYLDQFTLFIL